MTSTPPNDQRGSSFFHDPALGRALVRFAFCKRVETLREAGEQLRRLAR